MRYFNSQVKQRFTLSNAANDRDWIFTPGRDIPVTGTGRDSQIVSNRSTQCAMSATVLRTACGITYIYIVYTILYSIYMYIVPCCYFYTKGNHFRRFFYVKQT